MASKVQRNSCIVPPSITWHVCEATNSQHIWNACLFLSFVLVTRNESISRNKDKTERVVHSEASRKTGLEFSSTRSLYTKKYRYKSTPMYLFI